MLTVAGLASGTRSLSGLFSGTVLFQKPGR
jgi:hypothetical protein